MLFNVSYAKKNTCFFLYSSTTAISIIIDVLSYSKHVFNKVIQSKLHINISVATVLFCNYLTDNSTFFYQRNYAFIYPRFYCLITIDCDLSAGYVLNHRLFEYSNSFFNIYEYIYL